MNKSISSHLQMDDSCFDDFDPHLNFSKFLEEAKVHAKEEHFKASNEEETGRKWLEQEKKTKKSWKNTIFFWLKSDKKSKSLPKPERNPHTSNKRRVHVSGPIYNRDTMVDGRTRHRSTSGPIESLFSPSMRNEMEVPYMCLHQLSSNYTSHIYGPIYLVT